jgi:hypothetical protein
MQKALLSLSFIFLLLNCSCESLLEENAVVTATKLNVRQYASTDSQVLGQLTKGDTISIERPVFPGFAEISFQGEKAYVAKKYLQEVKDPEIALFSDSFGMGDFYALIVMILFMGLVLWGVTRFGHFILWRITLFKTHDISGFYFATLEANSGKRRIQFLLTRILGSRRQHPYLSYWVYVAFYYFLLPTFFLFPVLFFEGIGHLNLNLGGFSIKCSMLTIWLVLGIGIPVIIFLFKCWKNIRKEGSNNEWFAVAVALLFAIPVFLTTLLMAAFTYFKYVILAFFVMLKIFAPTRREWRYINNSDNDDYDGIANI